MTPANHKDAEIRATLLSAARELLTEDADFSLKTLLTRTGVTRARFRRCFADKEQLLAALTGVEVQNLGEILEAAAAQPQALRLAVGSDIAPAPMAAPPADAWLERRLRVFERALAGLEKRQEKAEQDMTQQLARMGETLSAFVHAQAAPQPAVQVRAAARAEIAQPEIAKPEIAKPEIAQPGIVWPEIIPAEIAPPENIPPEFAPAEMTAAEPMTVAPAGPLAGEPDLFHEIENRNEQGVGVDPAETAFAAALASAAAPPADKEISDFMAHARRVAQNASLAELAQPERPWNMRWLAWGGALLVALLICTGVLMTSGAFGGSAGANPVLRVSGETHRRPAAGGIAHVIALADSGDAGAQTLLALDYLKGNGVPSDAEAAQRWSLAAANQGQPVAQYVLGTLYLQADPNDSQAVRWFRAAADQGNVKAMHNLGIAFAQGQGVDKNPEEAVKWFTRAAAQGYRDSEFDLAVLYERGLGAPQSARAALKWYLIAAANGDAPSAARAKFLQEQVDPMIYRLAAQDAASFAAKPAGKAANETPDL